MDLITLPDYVMQNLECIHPLFDRVKNGITLTDENSKILYVNPAFSEITGYSKDDVIGGNPGILRSGYHDEAFYKKMWENIDNFGFWEGEIWNRQKSGKLYPSLLTITKLKNSDKKVSNYLAVFSDISFLEADNTEKINLAFYDPLTKLPNRLALEDQFNKTISAHKRKYYNKLVELQNKDKILILFFDLNKFKQVNDTYGHVVGDKLLKNVASRLQSVMRSTDIIARFGGDEFVGIIPGITTAFEIKEYCSRILEAFVAPFKIDELEIISRLFTQLCHPKSLNLTFQGSKYRAVKRSLPNLLVA
ncbi:sensor domain-containing diguanylate cyclase [Thiotrichales bacterium 19S3-7]|nr:sensor domain-containing diguanylate cyclase [Thiotrichales bacterium 19S3-7]MCF6803125.1 sensor domain-containing diguanylate cyclase [Thiotrichales bacterium 19S3-11]